MTLLQNLVPESVVRNLGWMLVHSLWQMGLVAILAAGALFLLRNRSANARYLAGCVALLLMVVLPAATLWAVWERAAPAATSVVPHWPTKAVATPGPAPLPGEPALPEQLNSAPRPVAEPWHAWARDLLNTHLSWVVAGWLLGVSLSMLRILVSWLRIQRLGRRGTEAMPAAWTARAIAMARSFGVSRTVQVLQSHLAQVPATIGYLRPVILLPVAAVTGLAPQQLEAIVAHELAHIRRFDCLVNLVQVLIETVLFYHPAIWWVSRRVRIERENCCDDAAIEVLADRFAYIRALVSLEELRDVPAPQLAVAWQGTSLLDRVRRLLGAPAPRTMQSGRWMAGPVVMIASLMLVGTLLVASPSTADSSAARPVEASATGPSSGGERTPFRPQWARYAITKTQKNKDGKDVPRLSYVLSKEYEPSAPQGAEASDQVSLQVWFTRVRPGTDISDAAKILGKSLAGKVIAGQDTLLRPREHVVLSDEQLRQLLAAAAKWGGQALAEYPERLSVPDRSSAVLSLDMQPTEVMMPDAAGQEKSPLSILGALRLAAKARIGAGRTVKLDCMFHVLETNRADSGKLGDMLLSQTTAQASAEVPPRSALVMPLSTDSLRATMYRKRFDADKPGVDLFLEPVEQEPSPTAEFMIVRPTIRKAGSPAQASDPDAFEPAGHLASGELNSRVAQIDMASAKLEDVVRVFGEPNSYTYNDKTFTKDNLPQGGTGYIMNYPGAFSAYMGDNRIIEFRFEGGSDYVWRGGLHVGSTLDEALAVLGPPTTTVEGEPLEFLDGVLYKDIDGRTGYGYYQRPDQGVRMWFLNNRVIGMYLTPVRNLQPVVSRMDAQAFNADLEAKVSQLTSQASRQEIIRIFGPPLKYFNGDETYTEDALPDENGPGYVMQYPAGVCVYSRFIHDGVRVGFSRPDANYAYRGKIRVGSSLEDLAAVIGQPDRIAEGNPTTSKGWEEGVLYKDVNGSKGLWYYGRRSLGVGAFVRNGRIGSMTIWPEAARQASP